MINLNNDVLNKNRRKLFPKIYTMSHKFSLNTINILKNQNPLKYYRSFYNKYIKKVSRNKPIIGENKNSAYLSILSKSQNYFFSLPIKYDSNLLNNINKSNKNLELNKFEKKIPKKIKNNLFFENNEIKYINFLKHKTLKNLHECLLNNKNNILKINKRSKSCINTNMIKKNEKNLFEKNVIKNKIIKNIEINNVISNSKKSQEQQTIESEYNNNNKVNKNNNEFKIHQVLIQGYKTKKPKYEIEKGRNRGIAINAKNKNCKIKDINTLDNLDNVKIFWNNLRKPIIINSSNYEKKNIN